MVCLCLFAWGSKPSTVPSPAWQASQARPPGLGLGPSLGPGPGWARAQSVARARHQARAWAKDRAWAQARPPLPPAAGRDSQIQGGGGRYGNEVMRQYYRCPFFPQVQLLKKIQKQLVANCSKKGCSQGKHCYKAIALTNSCMISMQYEDASCMIIMHDDHESRMMIMHDDHASCMMVIHCA